MSPAQRAPIASKSRQKWGSGKGKGGKPGRGKNGTRGTSCRAKGDKKGKGAHTPSFTEIVTIDAFRKDNLCYCFANGQGCFRRVQWQCPYKHQGAGGAAAAAPPAPAVPTAPKSTNAAQAMTIMMDGKSRGLTQADIMQTLTDSDFFAGTANVDWTAPEEPPYKPAAEDGGVPRARRRR
jgi:hypothetical protein